MFEDLKMFEEAKLFLDILNTVNSFRVLQLCNDLAILGIKIPN